jgi:hypothetical protein
MQKLFWMLFAPHPHEFESTSATSALTQSYSQLHIHESKPSMKSFLIQMGMNFQATNNLKENILQVFFFYKLHFNSFLYVSNCFKNY